MGLKSVLAGFLRWARWLAAREPLDYVPPGRGPETDPAPKSFLDRLFRRESLPDEAPLAGPPNPHPSLLRHILARDVLGRSEAAAGAPAGPSFLRQILAGETLGTADPAVRPPARPSFFLWLFSGEPLEERVPGSARDDRRP